jgi:hypothetical protein
LKRVSCLRPAEELVLKARTVVDSRRKNRRFENDSLEMKTFMNRIIAEEHSSMISRFASNFDRASVKALMRKVGRHMHTHMKDAFRSNRQSKISAAWKQNDQVSIRSQ